ncbi:MAG TPA: putative aminohydrolase SsnA [Blastocatellia bacterium]|nr:putative aminohydrolase SsnA [Blastocatellia bacterium]
MSYLFKSATLMTLDPPRIERGDLRVAKDRIIERSLRLDPVEGEEVITLDGKLLMPGLVCAHTHLYSALARGMPAPPRPPANFREILELVWWRLDRALDEETVYWSTIAGAMDAARAGTTCLFDHHASPSAITGSLKIVRDALDHVGLRGVLCYEITDRGGTFQRDLAIDESRSFLECAKDSTAFRGMVGAHAGFTLSDQSLELCASLMREHEAGLHIHAAEDLCDVEDARARYGLGVVERLARFSALNDRTILAHGTHLDQKEIEIARSAGAWFAHNPRSNMNNQVGYAPVESFGDRVLLGTDGIGADMFEESRTAFFKGRDEGIKAGAEFWVRALANNQRLASELFGAPIGSLERDAAADLVVLDYDSPTPLTAENLAWHFAFGLTSASVESVMARGRFIIRNRRSALDTGELYEKARLASEKLWKRLAEL